MNSLTELNSYSLSSVEYSDQRGFSITFSEVYNPTIIINEAQSHQSPVGSNITDIVSAPDTITYTVDLTSVHSQGVRLVWPTLPAGIISTENGTGEYTLVGINTLLKWELVKSPIITTPRDFSSNFAYTGEINAGGSNVRTWTTSVTVNDMSELSTLTPASITYDEDVNKAFGSGFLQITDTENTDGIYTLNATFSNTLAGNVKSYFTDANITSNVQPGNLTISSTKTYLNAYLNQAYYEPATDFASNVTLTWTLTNPVSSKVTTATQQLFIGNTNEEITNINVNRSYFNESYDLLFPTSQPYISEPDSENYVYTISLQLVAAIGVIGTDINDAGWNPVTNTYGFTGSQTQCNAKFQTLRFFPYSGVSSNSFVVYRQFRNGFFQGQSGFNLTGLTRPMYSGGTGNISLPEDGQLADWGMITSTRGVFDSNYIVVSCEDPTTGNLVNGGSWYDKRTGNALTSTTNLTPSVSDGKQLIFAYGVPTSYTDVIARDSLLGNIGLRLYPDRDQDFVIRQEAGPYGLVKRPANDGFYLDNAEYIVTKTVSVSNVHLDYSLTTNVNYTEDTTTALSANILDQDTRGTFAVTWSQQSPVNNPGRFKINGVYQDWGQNAYITGNATVINATTVEYDPPLEYDQTITLKYNQTKTRDNITVTQADIPVYLYCNSSVASDVVITADNYVRNTQGNISVVLNDIDDNTAVYSMTLTQTSPDVSITDDNLMFIKDTSVMSNPYATSTYTKIMTAGTNTITYYPPLDYVGTLGLTLVVTKTVGGRTVTLKTENLALTCASQPTVVTVNTISDTFMHEGNKVSESLGYNNNVLAAIPTVINDGSSDFTYWYNGVVKTRRFRETLTHIDPIFGYDPNDPSTYVDPVTEPVMFGFGSASYYATGGVTYFKPQVGTSGITNTMSTYYGDTPYYQSTAYLLKHGQPLYNEFINATKPSIYMMPHLDALGRLCVRYKLEAQTITGAWTEIENLVLTNGGPGGGDNNTWKTAWGPDGLLGKPLDLVNTSLSTTVGVPVTFTDTKIYDYISGPEQVFTIGNTWTANGYAVTSTVLMSGGYRLEVEFDSTLGYLKLQNGANITSSPWIMPGQTPGTGRNMGAARSSIRTQIFGYTGPGAGPNVGYKLYYYPTATGSTQVTFKLYRYYNVDSSSLNDPTYWKLIGQDTATIITT